MQKNIAVREAIEKSGYKYWQVAEKMGLTDQAFSRRLRKDFSEAENAKVLKALEELKQEDR